MKKTLIALFALVAVSFTANAQYNSLTINNSTTCEVWVIVHGTLSGNGCTGDYRSEPTLIPPGITTYSTPADIPMSKMSATPATLGSGDDFTFVRVYSSDPNGGCTLVTVNMTDCTTGITNPVANTTGFTIEDPNCMTACNSNVSMDYYGSSGVAYLDIY